MNVTSKDGTPVAVFRTGSGPPLILSTGSLSDHRRWAPVLPFLEQHLTVYAYDRRGRGESGDNPDYAIDREFEDMAAIAHAIDEPVSLLGHSFGGVIALESALRIKNLDKLILYEPPLFNGAEIQPPGIIDRIQALIDEGDPEGAVMKFHADVQKRAPEELVRLRRSTLWEMFTAAAHTLPREMRCIDEYRFNPSRFKDVHAPVLLLLGTKSPVIFNNAIKTIHASLPNSRIVTLPDQGHAAMDTGTELFASEIVKFLTV